MTATEAKARILALLDEVAAGGPSALKGKLAGVALSAATDEELFSTGEKWSLR